MAYSDFIGMYPLQKTLRFELKPQGRTMETLKEKDYLKNDLYRASQYAGMKKLIDDYHRSFIDESLMTSEIDWQPLADALDARKNNDEKSKKQLEILQDQYRRQVSKLFTGKEVFKSLFSKEVLDLVREKCVKERDDSKIQICDAFNRYSVYFTGFHENRRNFYVSDKQSTSISKRLVDDNFPKFLENIRIYEKIEVECPEIIEKVKNELKLTDLKKYFSVSEFNRFVRQCGIDDYNWILGGHVGEEAHVKGFNGFLNEAYQQGLLKTRVLMRPLYKMILSISESKSVLPYQFKDEKEMMDAVVSFIQKANEGIVAQAGDLLKSVESTDLSRVFIPDKQLTELSQILFGDWGALGMMMREYKAYDLGDPTMSKTMKKVDNWMKSSEFSLEDVKKAVLHADQEFTLENYEVRVDQVCSKLIETNAVSELKSVKIDGTDGETRNRSAECLRCILEGYQDLLHCMNMFKVSDELDRDEAFYSEFDLILGELQEIIPLFNKVRNYCTKKAYNETKVKLKLSTPTLADGWDLDKEKDNKAVILRSGGQYYLGVNCDKGFLDFSKYETDDEECFEKLNYKLLPGPNKMLPKVFFSKSWKSEHTIPERIQDGYDRGIFKKGPEFDLMFCHELIDFYKESISIHPVWSKFDFRFAETSDYQDISQFYADVQRQGFKMSFSKVSKSEVYKLVDEGKLMLFKIHSKDFSENSRGMPNMHTLYWRALFSEENLANIRIKLNGEAELFFREKSIDTPVVHKSGSVLVNKTFNGKHVPDKIYYELFRYRNGIITSLSPEAKEYEGAIVTSVANYDIVKDRRYTVDKLFFHVPLTFNFGVPDRSKDINRMVLEHAIKSKDVKIIGIDRGERNLIYISMIDKEGKILLQKSLNVIDGVDYHGNLDVREHENKEARRNWTKVAGIKDLKEGYLSAAVSQIARMVVENDAIVVMENLNYGFKHGRFKIEKQVYQKFESMLIDKLNYLVFKDKEDFTSDGRAMRGYQLTKPIDSVKEIGTQTGVIFYVNAAYTSKIDPTTGFINQIQFSTKSTLSAKRDLLCNIDSIRYDPSEECYVFRIDYTKVGDRTKEFKNVWDIYTRGERIVYSTKERCDKHLHPTEIMTKALESAGIGKDGELKEKICSADSKVIEAVVYALDLTLRLRNEDRETDYILSPVRNADGKFFCTLDGDLSLPLDSDANGAYNIALKGLLMLKMTEESNGPDADKYDISLVTNSDWLTFCQTGHRTWKS